MMTKKMLLLKESFDIRIYFTVMSIVKIILKSVEAQLKHNNQQPQVWMIDSSN